MPWEYPGREVVVPFVAYVHAHEPEPPEGRRQPWEPNWRVWRWIVAAAVAAYASAHSGGAVAALLMLLVFTFVCQAAAAALPDGDGLREHRQ
jgi:hypothetical protein